MAESNGTIRGCTATISGLVVTVLSGYIYVGGAELAVASGSVTCAAADPSLDRYDTVEASATDGSLQIATGTPGSGFAPVDDGYEPLYIVYVAAGSSTGVLTDVRQGAAGSGFVGQAASTVYAGLPLPANTLAYTFLSGAQAGDPGAGNIGFDTTAVNTLTTLYVSYSSPSWSQVAGTGGYTTLKDWLQPLSSRGNPVVPFYLKLWSRKQPNRYVMLEVTSFTDHGTPSSYATLGVTLISYVQNDLGAVGTAIPLSTDAYDTIVEFDGAYPPVQSVFGRTGAVVAADGDYYGVVAEAKTGATAASRYVGATASGAPASGTFSVGDHVIDQTGTIWVCTVAGSPGTWVNVQTTPFWDTEVKCSADRTRTAQTLGDITDLSIALAANTLYEFECLLVLNSSSSAGVESAIQYSAAGAVLDALFDADTSITRSSVTVKAFNTASPAWASATTQDYLGFYKGWVKTGANTGNLTAQYLKVTSGTVTARKGSLLRVRKLA